MPASAAHRSLELGAGAKTAEYSRGSDSIGCRLARARSSHQKGATRCRRRAPSQVFGDRVTPSRLAQMRYFLWQLAVVASALSACSWKQAIESDPSAWNPAASLVAPDAATDGAAGSSATEVEGCDATPDEELALTESGPERGSHRAGEPCLTGCHESGGSAKLVFAAAGTAYRAQGQRTVAEPGREVRGVGGSVLQLDACGNFYAIAAVLRAATGSTQPWLKDPIFRHMEKPLQRAAQPGDCNQSSCHDFSGRLNSGIYF